MHSNDRLMLRKLPAAWLLALALSLLAPPWDGHAAGPAPRFPLQVTDDHRHLVDQHSVPFLYNADTPWMLFFKLTQAQAKEYILRRKEQGFYVLQVQLTGFLGLTNRAGDLPFAGTPPEQNFAEPNERILDHVDRVIGEAERQGMLLAIAPAWLRPDLENAIAVQGRGPVAMDNATVTAVAVDGSLAIAYIPVKRSLTMDLSKLAGPQINAWWFNPRTGEATRIAELKEKHHHIFTPPDDQDWVLVLDDAALRFLAPGATPIQK